MTSSLGYLLVFSILGFLNPYIGNGLLYSFEAMVFRFPLQLKSLNLDHKNSSYGILHSDYSNLQNISRLFFLAQSSPFEGFLGTLGLQFVYPSFK